MVFSNTWFARIAVFPSLGLGVATYDISGLPSGISLPSLTPLLAALASFCIGTLAFFLSFGLLTTHWFGWKFWFGAAVWGAIWLGAFRYLGSDWLLALGLTFAALTPFVVGFIVPDSELNDRLQTGRRN